MLAVFSASKECTGSKVHDKPRLDMIGRATGEENEPFLSGCRARTRGRLVSWAIGWTGLAGALATGSGYEADRLACAGSSNTGPRVRALYSALQRTVSPW